MKTQKIYECQNINFNKNVLIFFSSNYINWILIAIFAQYICENCISTFFAIVFKRIKFKISYFYLSQNYRKSYQIINDKK